MITATINKEADAINNRINNDLDSKLNELDVDNDDNGSTDNNDNGQKDNDEYYLEECQKSLENRDIARHELFRWAFKLVSMLGKHSYVYIYYDFTFLQYDNVESILF